MPETQAGRGEGGSEVTITSGSSRGTRIFQRVITSPSCSTAGSRLGPSPPREPVPPQRCVYVPARRPRWQLGARTGAAPPALPERVPASGRAAPRRTGAPRYLRAQRHDARGGVQREKARTPARLPLTCGGSTPGPRRRAVRTSRAGWARGQLRGRGRPGARGAPAPAAAAAAAASGAAWAAAEPGGPHE